MSLLLLLLLLPCAASAPAHAAVLLVPSQFPAIQLALNAASPGDTVQVAPGVYTGAQNRNLDFGGTDLVLRSSGGADATIIDCQGNGRGLHFNQGEGPNAVVEGFTVTGGMATPGGGIWVGGSSSPTFRSCTIRDNHVDPPSGAFLRGGGVGVGGNSSPRFEQCRVATNSLRAYAGEAEGGGIFVYGGSSVVLIECDVVENDVQEGHQGASGDGGGIYLAPGAALRMAGCRLLENSALGGDIYPICGGLGSAIYAGANASVQLTSCELSENIACSGAIYLTGVDALTLRHCSFRSNQGYALNAHESTLEISDSEFVHHEARNAGAIVLRDSSVLIRDSVFRGNLAWSMYGVYGAPGEGGAIAATSSLLSISGSEFSGNRAYEYGGAIWCRDTQLTMDQCTLAGNRAEDGGGIYLTGVSSAEIRQTILRENCASESGEDLWIDEDCHAQFFCSALAPVGVSGPGSWSTDGQEIVESPQFCSSAPCALAPTVEGSYKLAYDSPCSPANAPCGEQVGAWPVACVETAPNGACCLPDAVCVIANENSCALLEGNWNGGDTECLPNPCVGACCADDGVCVPRDAAQCAEAGGTFTGLGVRCRPGPCAPGGACCFPDGSCQILAQQACEEDGGYYRGSQYPCDPSPCDGVGACCLGETCEATTEPACHGSGGRYLGDGVSCPPDGCNRNPGGVHILHARPGITFSQGTDYCDASALTDCSEIEASIPHDEDRVFWLVAAFPQDVTPEVSSVVFGLEYPPDVYLSASVACGSGGAFEIGEWPASESGLVVAWTTPETRRIFDVVWFYGYSARFDDDPPTQMRVVAHETEGGYFTSPEGSRDPVIGYGVLGFGGDGYGPCPPEPRGACCLPNSGCGRRTPLDCEAQGGSFLGLDASCQPDPCATSDVADDDAYGDSQTGSTRVSRLDFSGPNPVRGAATWRLALPATGHVSIRMFDLLGRTRRTLFEGTCAAGFSEVSIGDGDGKSLVRGVYFVEVRAGTERITRPVVVLH